MISFRRTVRLSVLWTGHGTGPVATFETVHPHRPGSLRPVGLHRNMRVQVRFMALEPVKVHRNRHGWGPSLTCHWAYMANDLGGSGFV